MLLNLGHTFTNDYDSAVAVQADGKIVAGGAKYSSSFPSVMRLNAAGSIDTEFRRLPDDLRHLGAVAPRAALTRYWCTASKAPVIAR